MPYSPAVLRPGDVLLCRGTGHGLGALLDDAIRWATLSPWDHALIVGDNGRLVNPVWRVQFARLDAFADTADAFRIVGATGEQCALAASWARCHVGWPYSLRDLLEDGGRDLLHIPFLPRMHPHRWTCSGFVAAAWHSAGVTITRAPLPSPADLFNSPILIPLEVPHVERATR